MNVAGGLEATLAGFCCAAGDFISILCGQFPYARNVHAHTGRAIARSWRRETLAIMAIRCGPDFAGAAQAAGCGEKLRLGEAELSFHPAGRVLGPAQIRMACPGRVIVVSGDYKREPGPNLRRLRAGSLRCLRDGSGLRPTKNRRPTISRQGRRLAP